MVNCLVVVKDIAVDGCRTVIVVFVPVVEHFIFPKSLIIIINVLTNASIDHMRRLRSRLVATWSKELHFLFSVDGG